MLTLEAFKSARAVLQSVLRPTPLIHSPYLSKNCGNSVYLKPENMQATGAYKLRGAYYKISTLSQEEKDRGLVTASAGNHAQGVAYAAQAAGVAALREGAYVKTLRNLIQEQRPLLRQGLEALGLTVVPGEANYLLFRAPKPLSAHLRQRGIMLRDCGNYHNLEGNWYRVAVRTGSDNQALLRALEEVLS